jgi:hypothetical protein
VNYQGSASSPFFSVCIPQYERSDFLLRALMSLASQSFRDFEICVSDDRSPDGRQDEIQAALEGTGVPYRFHCRQENGRYDANLRSAIGLARGTYCFLLGNDDALREETLARTYELMKQYGPCGVVITDFEDFKTGKRANRIRTTGNRGSGPQAAVNHFRNFSFVSGVVLHRSSAQQFATEKWDSSEMYQTFIGCRIIASGDSLLEIGEPLIRKDIVLPSRSVDSYASRPRLRSCPIEERPIPLVKLGSLVADAIAVDKLDPKRRSRSAAILLQILLFTYPFWLFEYRRVQSWKYAAGIALAMRPSRISGSMPIGILGSWLIKACYLGVTLLGLLLPRWSFEVSAPAFYRWAKQKSGR